MGLTAVAAVAAAEPVTYEAEKAVMTDLAVDTTVKGFSGESYVMAFTNEAGSLTFNVDAPAAGLYEMVLGYATPSGGKWCNLIVNELPEGEIELPGVEGFAETKPTLVLLQQGANKLTIEKGWGFYAIDFLKLSPAAELPPHQVTAELINPSASAPAKALMAFLVSNFGKNIIAGQQEYPQNPGREVKQLRELTGKEPALVGQDFMDLTPSRVKKGTSSKVVDEAIAWHERGGIVAFSWHWDSPLGQLPGPEHEWKAFNTNATSFDLAAAMADPESEAYKLLVSDIDAIAGHLKQLRDRNIPVLWRPLHEAEGGWFWWGAKGPEACKKLWALMVDRMTNHHQLNNLIWVWNSTAPEWYPGNHLVDIASYDSFPAPHNHNPASAFFRQLVAVTDNRKLIAMAEAGSIPDPDLIALTKSHWAWFNSWNSNVRDQNSDDHLRKLYSHPNVITLDELPKF